MPMQPDALYFKLVTKVQIIYYGMPTSIVRNELLIIPQAVYTSINVQVNVFEFKSVKKIIHM